ncbi:hypothetical protein DFH06DRAFT_756114 [Mycena polygramma]|nr:hypothetical protein DFH06DRAFT_756114 [Mycena polygramma]
MVELAQELIDTIVDEVAATQNWFDLTDHKSLKACALVARTFRVPSQRRLFRCLTLSKGALKKIAPGLAAAPHICAYVYDLSVNSLYSETDPKDEIALATIFMLLSRVRRLVISGRFQWQTEEFCAGLISILSLPSLRCFGLLSCEHVPETLLFQALRHYEQVVVRGSDFKESCKAFELPSAHCTAPLHRLALMRCSVHGLAASDLMVREDIVASFQNLRHLGLAALDVLMRIAAKYLDSLQTLEIYFDTGHDLAIDPPDMPALRFLTLQAEVIALRIPASFVAIMAALPERMPNVEIVTLLLDGELDSRRQDSSLAPADRALKALPNLRKVHFEAHAAWTIELFIEATTAHLPMAHNAGLLSFSQGSYRGIMHPMRYFSH